MTQPVTVHSGVPKDHFDHDSLEVLRPRVAGVDVHKMQVRATMRLCEPDRSRPSRATRESSVLPPWLFGHSVPAAATEGTGILSDAPCTWQLLSPTSSGWTAAAPPLKGD